ARTPAPPHAKYDQSYVYCCPKCSGIVKPFAPPAAIAIDWSLKGERIGGRTRPLAPATMARIQAGIDKYWRTPGVVDLTYTGTESKVRSVEDPLFTQTARAALSLYRPFVTEMHGTSGTRDIADPMLGITAGGHHHGLTEA